MVTRRRIRTDGSITANEIIKIYKSTFGVQWWQTLFGYVSIELADQTYFPVDINKLKEVVKKDNTELQQYSLEDYDCDDFAFSLMGALHRDRETACMPIFITWVNTPQGGHALLSFYRDGAIYMLEPQNDQIFNVPPDWSLILVCG